MIASFYLVLNLKSDDKYYKSDRRNTFKNTGKEMFAFRNWAIAAVIAWSIRFVILPAWVRKFGIFVTPSICSTHKDSNMIAQSMVLVNYCIIHIELAHFEGDCLKYYGTICWSHVHIVSRSSWQPSWSSSEYSYVPERTLPQMIFTI